MFLTRKTAIEVRSVGKTFGQGEAAVRALDTVSLEIRQGEFFTFLGPSGSLRPSLWLPTGLIWSDDE